MPLEDTYHKINEGKNPLFTREEGIQVSDEINAEMREVNRELKRKSFLPLKERKTLITQFC